MKTTFLHFSNKKLNKLNKGTFAFKYNTYDFPIDGFGINENGFISAEIIENKQKDDLDGVFSHVGFNYGSNIHVFTLDVKNILDFTDIENIEKYLRENDLYEKYKDIIDELDDDTVQTIYNYPELEKDLIEIGISNTYDIIIVNDSTEGTDHEAYIILNEINIY